MRSQLNLQLLPIHDKLALSLGDIEDLYNALLYEPLATSLQKSPKTDNTYEDHRSLPDILVQNLTTLDINSKAKAEKDDYTLTAFIEGHYRIIHDLVASIIEPIHSSYENRILGIEYILKISGNSTLNPEDFTQVSPIVKRYQSLGFILANISFLNKWGEKTGSSQQIAAIKAFLPDRNFADLDYFSTLLEVTGEVMHSQDELTKLEEYLSYETAGIVEKNGSPACKNDLSLISGVLNRSLTNPHHPIPSEINKLNPLFNSLKLAQQILVDEPSSDTPTLKKAGEIIFGNPQTNSIPAHSPSK